MAVALAEGILLGGCLLWISQATAAELILVDGRRQIAELMSFRPDGTLGFLANLEPVELRASEVVYWGWVPELVSPIFAVFADGSLLAANAVRIDQDRVHLRGSQYLDVAIPVEFLAGVVLQAPGRREALDRLVDEIVAARGQQDEAVLVNGDRMGGFLVRLDEQMCLFEIAGGTTQLPRENLMALSFHPQLRAKLPAVNKSGGSQTPPLGPRMWVGLLDGSVLLCDWGHSDGPAVELALSLGAKLSVKTGAVVFLLPLSERWIYLSELEPAEYEHRPFLSIARPLGRDRSAVGSRLRKNGRLYLKGLGMQSWSRVVYRLGRGYQRFECLVALDDLAAGQGSVEFVVRVDDQEKYRSGIIRGTDDPRAVRVDLQGAETLELIVEFADRAHEFDYADWLLARLVR
jgi:hypothetical protein